MKAMLQADQEDVRALIGAASSLPGSAVWHDGVGQGPTSYANAASRTGGVSFTGTPPAIHSAS